MEEARQRATWAPFSALMALLANCHRDPKRQRTLKPADFDPFRRREKPLKVSIEVLKDIFVNRSLPRGGCLERVD